METISILHPNSDLDATAEVLREAAATRGTRGDQKGAGAWLGGVVGAVAGGVAGLWGIATGNKDGSAGSDSNSEAGEPRVDKSARRSMASLPKVASPAPPATPPRALSEGRSQAYPTRQAGRPQRSPSGGSAGSAGLRKGASASALPPPPPPPPPATDAAASKRGATVGRYLSAPRPRSAFGAAKQHQHQHQRGGGEADEDADLSSGYESLATDDSESSDDDGDVLSEARRRAAAAGARAKAVLQRSGMGSVRRVVSTPGSAGKPVSPPPPPPPSSPPRQKASSVGAPQGSGASSGRKRGLGMLPRSAGLTTTARARSLPDDAGSTGSGTSAGSRGMNGRSSSLTPTSLSSAWNKLLTLAGGSGGGGGPTVAHLGQPNGFRYDERLRIWVREVSQCVCVGATCLLVSSQLVDVVFIGRAPLRRHTARPRHPLRQRQVWLARAATRQHLQHATLVLRCQECRAVPAPAAWAVPCEGARRQVEEEEVVEEGGRGAH